MRAHVCERAGRLLPAHVPACVRVCRACVREGVARSLARVGGRRVGSHVCVRAR